MEDIKILRIKTQFFYYFLFQIVLESGLDENQRFEKAQKLIQNPPLADKWIH